MGSGKVPVLVSFEKVGGYQDFLFMVSGVYGELTVSY